ncbi:hypothetical protein [Pseudohoeflea coraliihabitans]|uniref:Uncharacterized protein n=1 Tax=Pseudohoeflea coraliihabitans TaxID=2860393 RepID=A0ABS6WM35_9HYPH|nr:hypothetical protein [Pseudohoeflea sp. DP4N28-3]MBW3096845.1 hypothetical protein [Pseudohoeflea sp. DP4N28-3]
MKTLDTAAWTDFHVQPVTLGYHARAIAAQQRTTDKLCVPFPAFNVIDERASYDAHKAQAEKVIEAAMDLIIDQIEIVRDMAEQKTDRKELREQIEETVSEALFDADDYYEQEDS